VRWNTDNSFVRELPEFYAESEPTPVRAPELVVLNEQLADQLGLSVDELRSPDGVAVLGGNEIPDGAHPIAQAYVGHQFGNFNPSLGDGRAHLLAEVIDRDGNRYDIGLKGSGRTRFSRNGDGRAALGAMLREYIVSEAMHSLHIATTRSLAVVATGETVIRQPPSPGAVLTRVAASHIRVGTFELFRTSGDAALLARLVEYVRARHYPDLEEGDAAALLEAVVGRQAELIAAWMSVGFIHGVMNTDNMTLSGETIDYGPCAFMEGYDPDAVFSSIDHNGRYRYRNQPQIAVWNLARLAEVLLMLTPEPSQDDIARYEAILGAFDGRYEAARLRLFRAKLGIDDRSDRGGVDGDFDAADTELIDDLLVWMAAERRDFTSTFRNLAQSLRHSNSNLDAIVASSRDGETFVRWRNRWLDRLGDVDRDEIAEAMDRVNPIYIPRNHLVEAALAAANKGDLAPTNALIEAIRQPFNEREGLEAFAEPAPDSFTSGYVTYCGT